MRGDDQTVKSESSEVDQMLSARKASLEPVLQVWRESLIDVSGRNQLLYFRKPTVAGIDLTQAPSDVIHDLLDGKEIRANKLVSGSVEVDALVKSLRSIEKNSRTSREEFGLDVTYVAAGFVQWDSHQASGMGGPDTSSTPLAPVLLWPTEVKIPSGNPNGATVKTADFVVNQTWIHLLMNVTGIEIDLEDLIEKSDTWQGLVTSIVSRFSAELRVSPVERMFLANFNSVNQSMIDDLSIDSIEFLAESDVVSALSGNGEARDRLSTAGASVNFDDPDRKPPENEFLTLDADASQSYVINAVDSGQNLVVQGPPGTGKSQTIANLISTLVAKEKTILFVAQKRAAIDAVLRRLESVQLDHLVLDLLEEQKSRRYVADSVKQSVVSASTAALPDTTQLFTTISAERERLLQHAEAIRERRPPWNLAYVEGPGSERVGLVDIAIRGNKHLGFGREFALADLQLWNEGDYENTRDEIERLHDLGGLSPDYERSLNLNSEVLDRSEVDSIANVVATLTHAFQRMQHAFKISVGTELTHSLTFSQAQELSRLSAQIASFTAKHGDASLQNTLTDEALSTAVEATQGLSPFVSNTHDVKGDLKRLTRSRLKWLQHSTLKQAQALRQSWREITHLDASFSLQSLPDDFTNEVRNLASAIDLLAPKLQNFLPDETRLVDLQVVVRELGKVEVLLGRRETNSIRKKMRNRGLQPLFDEISECTDNSKDVAVAFYDRMFATPILKSLRLSDQRMSTGASLSSDSTRYASHDKQTHAANAERIRHLVADRLVTVRNAEPTQSELVISQTKRKKGFLPVRELIRRAPKVMLAAKPVWAMSPSTVSKLLPRQQIFDVVIFDEASQVELPHAIPALARGRQIVIAGDDRQLPPDRTFSKTLETGLEEIDDNDENEETALAVTDVESVLDGVEQKIGPERSRYLQWHYRSEDERLIATSNEYVYRPIGRGLTTFPSARRDDVLVHHQVAASTGIGSNNKSPIDEVLKVADLVQEHAAEQPDVSLGVITPGSDHRDRVLEELNQRAKDDHLLQQFIDRDDLERFFVKNLERVQGDERDRIIFTVGYGRRDNGEVSKNWGPINQSGGERRVNVAISRAKQRIDLVTSFASDDLAESTNDGFELARQFVRFVGTGGKEFAGTSRSATHPENPVEFDVLRRLRERNLQVIPQYGVGTRRIDFAIMHPEHPGRPILAVEFDGASYHSHPLARERDRLRQSLLEARGWIFHRIWSTDYFDDPDGQIDAVIETVGNVLGAESGSTVSAKAPEEKLWETSSKQRTERPRFHRNRKSISEYRNAEIDEVIAWIKSDGIPRTDEEIYLETRSFLGFQRKGDRIDAAIYAAIARAP